MIATYLHPILGPASIIEAVARSRSCDFKCHIGRTSGGKTHGCNLCDIIIPPFQKNRSLALRGQVYSQKEGNTYTTQRQLLWSIEHIAKLFPMHQITAMVNWDSGTRKSSNSRDRNLLRLEQPCGWCRGP